MKKISISYASVFSFLKYYCFALLAYTFFMPDENITLLQCILLGAGVYFDLFEGLLRKEDRL